MIVQLKCVISIECISSKFQTQDFIILVTCFDLEKTTKTPYFFLKFVLSIPTVSKHTKNTYVKGDFGKC